MAGSAKIVTDEAIGLSMHQERAGAEYTQR